MRKTRNRAFTLIEIVIAVSILGMLAGVVGFHFKKMVDLHRFRKHVGLFIGDLQKLQIVSLSRRADFEIYIFKEDDKWAYVATCDEPINLYGKGRKIFLDGVSEIQIDKKPPKKLPIKLSVFPSGRIEPLEIISFIPKGLDAEETILLDLKTPLQLVVKNQQVKIS